MEVNAINAGDYFKDKNTELDAKYDFNSDGTVDVADYYTAISYLEDPTKSDQIEFSQAELDAVFAALIEEDETVNKYEEIDPAKANDAAEAIIAKVKSGLVDPGNAKTLNELQTIGATLTKYIKECSDIAKVLGEQVPSAKKELDSLEGEKENKNREYIVLEQRVNDKTSDLNKKTQKILEKSNAVTEEFQENCTRVINECVENYKNGAYTGKSLSEVIVSELGNKAGVNTTDLKREMNNATSIGMEIKTLCSDIEDIVVDIRDIQTRYNAKNTDYNRTVNNRNDILACAQTASNNYQKGYTVRQDMRKAIVDKYHVAGNNGVTSGNPQIGKLAEFLDAKELDNMPFADAWNILKETFDGCGITFNDQNHTMAVPKGHDSSAAAIYNALVQSVYDNYGVNSTRTDVGYEDADDGTAGGATRTDPLGFTNNNVRYEFVADKNGNGKFDNQNEFLGAEKGWEEMIAYDVDGDNIISGDELEKLKVVAIDQTSGQHSYMNAKLAGIDSIDLNSYQQKNTEQITNDLLAGTFKVNVQGKEIEAQHTLDTQMNLENKYSFLFGSDISDLSGTYKENPFMEDFKETVDTEKVVDKAHDDIDSTAATSDGIIKRGERRTKSDMNNSVEQAESEKRVLDLKAENDETTQTTQTDDINKKKLL